MLRLRVILLKESIAREFCFLRVVKLQAQVNCQRAYSRDVSLVGARFGLYIVRGLLITGRWLRGVKYPLLVFR